MTGPDIEPAQIQPPRKEAKDWCAEAKRVAKARRQIRSDSGPNSRVAVIHMQGWPPLPEGDHANESIIMGCGRISTALSIADRICAAASSAAVRVT